MSNVSIMALMGQPAAANAAKAVPANDFAPVLASNFLAADAAPAEAGMSDLFAVPEKPLAQSATGLLEVVLGQFEQVLGDQGSYDGSQVIALNADQLAALAQFLHMPQPVVQAQWLALQGSSADFNVASPAVEGLPDTTAPVPLLPSAPAIPQLAAPVAADKAPGADLSADDTVARGSTTDAPPAAASVVKPVSFAMEQPITPVPAPASDAALQPSDAAVAVPTQPFASNDAAPQVVATPVSPAAEAAPIAQPPAQSVAPSAEQAVIAAPAIVQPAAVTLPREVAAVPQKEIVSADMPECDAIVKEAIAAATPPAAPKIAASKPKTGKPRVDHLVAAAEAAPQPANAKENVTTQNDGDAAPVASLLPNAGEKPSAAVSAAPVSSSPVAPVAEAAQKPADQNAPTDIAAAAVPVESDKSLSVEAHAARQHQAAAARQELPMPVREQVMVQVRHGMQEGMSRMTIRLDPAELGQVEVKLELGSDGRSTIVMTVEHKDTLDMLQRDQRHLQRALNEMGLNADGSSMSFNLKEQNKGNQQQADGQGTSRASQATGADAIDDEPVNPAQALRYYSVSMDEGLNIKV